MFYHVLSSFNGEYRCLPARQIEGLRAMCLGSSPCNVNALRAPWRAARQLPCACRPWRGADNAATNCCKSGSVLWPVATHTQYIIIYCMYDIDDMHMHICAV